MLATSRGIAMTTIRILLTLSSLLYFLSAGCASPNAHTLVEVETVAIYVDYNDKMLANLESIREMVQLLKISLAEQLDRYPYRTDFLTSPAEFAQVPHHYILKIKLQDYQRSGPAKTVFMHYDFTGEHLPVLTSDITLSTVKGSSKLMTVIANQLAEIINERVKAHRISQRETD
jgi:hypothetical protein